MNAELRDVGEERARRQDLSISQKYHGPEVATERDETCQPLKLATSLNWRQQNRNYRNYANRLN